MRFVDFLELITKQNHLVLEYLLPVSRRSLGNIGVEEPILHCKKGRGYRGYLDKLDEFTQKKIKSKNL